MTTQLMSKVTGIETQFITTNPDAPTDAERTADTETAHDLLQGISRESHAVRCACLPMLCISLSLPFPCNLNNVPLCITENAITTEEWWEISAKQMFVVAIQSKMLRTVIG